MKIQRAWAMPSENMICGMRVHGIWYVSYHGIRLPCGQTLGEVMEYARRLRALDARLRRERSGL